MSESANFDDVTGRVLDQMAGAAQALRNKDIEGVTRCLHAAITIYEDHPSYLQHATNLLCDILVAIRATLSVCNTLGVPEDELRGLDQRAEALRRSHLH